MNRKNTGYLFLILTFFIWGSLYVISKYALAVMPPVTVLLGRYGLSVIILFFIARARGFKKIEREDWKYFIIIGFVGYFFSIACQLTGTKLLDASLASLINSLNPVAIPIMAAVFLKERITAKKAIGIAVSIAGIYIILGKGDGSMNLMGVAASILSVLCWSVSSVTVRRIAGKYDPIQISLVGMLLALIPNIPAAAAELMTTPCALTASAVLALLYMAAVCTALAHTLWNKSLQILSAGTCSMLYPLQPLTSAVMGVLVLHEGITLSFVIGAVIICAGVLISVRE